MKFECESCHAQYMIADEKVGKRGVKVKCKRCSHVIIVRPEGAPAAAEAAAPAAAPAAAKARVEVAAGAKASPLDAPPNLEATSPKSIHVEKSGDDRATDDSDSPEVTGPARPAPVSMMANKGADTQLGDDENPAWGADKTEMGMQGAGNTEVSPQAPSDVPLQGRSGPAPAVPSDAPEKTVVQAAAVLPPEAKPPEAKAAAAAPAVKGESSIGDALDDQLAGAFNNMFDEGQRPSLDDLAAAAGDLHGEPGEGNRGPTRVLDVDAMNSLRRQTAAASASVVDRDALDILRKDLSPQNDEASGLWDEKRPGAAAAKASKKKDAPDGADDGPAASVWHAAIDDEDVGPLTLAELGRHIEGGRVDRDSLVWKAGMGDWLPAGEIDAVKALFDRVPMPKIAAPEETDSRQKRNGRPSSFDVGSPIDDLSDGSRGPGGSPFDNAPPMDGEESDPAWRPHGLTDVYQAANLAEAAGAGGGMGGMSGLIGGGAGMTARGGGASTPPAQFDKGGAENEWRPSASSALASLVNNEIDRLSKGPQPADDDDLNAPRPADDASISGSLPFSNLSGVNLDAGPEVSDSNQRPGMPSMGGMGGMGNMGGMGGSFDSSGPNFSAQAFQPPPSTPAAPAKSPLLYAGIGGGALLLMMFMALISYKVLFAPPPQQQVVMIGPDGRPIQAGLPLPPTPTPTPGVTTPTPAATGLAAVTPPAGTDPANPANAATPATPAGTDAATPPNQALIADATPPPAATDKPDGPKVTPKANTPPKPPKPRRDEPDAPPPTPTPKATPKGCDPVLDFDCKPSGKAAAEPKADVKDTLEKADILAVVKGALPKVKDCGSKNKATGTIKMSWKIQTNGKTSDVAVADAKYGGTPTGACVTGVIKAMKFPPSNKPPPPVSIPLPLQ